MLSLKALARWTEDFAWRRADAVIPVTQVLAGIVEQSGVARERIEVMSNGIDTRILGRATPLRGAREALGWWEQVVLGFTGFVRAWNGLEAVVDLLAAPGSEAMVLLVVGDGTARQAIEERAARLGVQDRVRFTGLVKRSEIQYWVSAFDIALQPAANPYASPLKLFDTWRSAARSWLPTSRTSARSCSTSATRCCSILAAMARLPRPCSGWPATSSFGRGWPTPRLERSGNAR